MPMVFGHEVPTKTLWIGGGLIAAAVAVVVWLRARAAQAGAAQPEQPAEGTDQGGGGMTVPAPTPSIADQYQQQLSNSQLEANNIANQYQRQLMSQQQKQFDFNQRMQEILAPGEIAASQAQFAEEAHYERSLAAAPVGCPGRAALYLGPDGVPYCRQKTAGNVLTHIINGVTDLVNGVAQAAPEIGYQAAHQAANYELGRVFNPSRGTVGGRPAGQPAASTPSFLPTRHVSGNLMSGSAIGYEEEHLG